MRNICFISMFVALLFGMVSSLEAVEIDYSVLDQNQLSLRYSTISNEENDGSFLRRSDDYPDDDQETTGQKSPAKAFLFSFILPGAGQYYAGSKIKPVAYLGIEVTSWILYSRWQSDANSMTDEFEQFNRDHWSEADYTSYIEWAYGETDDENITATEMSHHLPDTRTQQYYEMTGKYDQFIWGWDDAELNGRTLQTYNISNPPPRLLSDATTPTSQNRIKYERMRKNTDDRYTRATRMIYVSMLNHFVSAFEAFIMVKKQNRRMESTLSKVMSRTDLRASLRSFNAPVDTPFMTLSYNF